MMSFPQVDRTPAFETCSFLSLFAYARTEFLRSVAISAWPQLSYDADIITRIREEGPYQLVYIDALHGYQAVMAELEFVSSVLSKNGFIVLHDTSVEATEYDPEKMGGVRRAVREFCASHEEFNPI